MVTANGLITEKNSINPAEWKIKPSFAKNLELLAGSMSDDENEAEEMTEPCEAAGINKILESNMNDC